MWVVLVSLEPSQQVNISVSSFFASIVVSILLFIFISFEMPHNFELRPQMTKITETKANVGKREREEKKVATRCFTMSLTGHTINNSHGCAVPVTMMCET